MKRFVPTLLVVFVVVMTLQGCAPSHYKTAGWVMLGAGGVMIAVGSQQAEGDVYAFIYPRKFLMAGGGALCAFGGLLLYLGYGMEDAQSTRYRAQLIVVPNGAALAYRF